MYFSFLLLFLPQASALHTTPVDVWRQPTVLSSSSKTTSSKPLWPYTDSSEAEDSNPRTTDPINGLPWAFCSSAKDTCSCQGWVRMSSVNLTFENPFFLNSTSNTSSSLLLSNFLNSVAVISPSVSVPTSVECTVPSLRARIWPEMRTAGTCDFRTHPHFRLRLGLYCLWAPEEPATNGWPGPGLTGDCKSGNLRSLWVYHAESGQIRNNGNCLTARGGISIKKIWEPLVVTMKPCGISDHENFQAWNVPELIEPSPEVMKSEEEVGVRTGVGRITLRDGPSKIGNRCLQISDPSSKDKSSIPLTEPALFLEAGLCRDVRKSHTGEIFWEVLAKEGKMKASDWKACPRSEPGCLASCGKDCEFRGRSGNFLTEAVSVNGGTSETNFQECSVEALRVQKFPINKDYAAACYCQPAGNVPEIWTPLRERDRLQEP